jgi:hypothetical protein
MEDNESEVEHIKTTTTSHQPLKGDFSITETPPRSPSLSSPSLSLSHHNHTPSSNNSETSWSPSLDSRTSTPPPQCVTPPLLQTNSKRFLGDHSVIFPSVSPKKKPKVQVLSATRMAIQEAEARSGEKAHGLLRFYRPSTWQVEYNKTVVKQIEESRFEMDKREKQREAAAVRKKARERENARLRKQKSRLTKKEKEVNTGIRSPGGTKRKFKELKLEDGPSSFESQEKGLPELSRPAREIQKKIKIAKRKPQGPMPHKVPRPAKYMNWFSPFLWSQINTAARITGWKMSATEIVHELRKHNPETFGKISRTTVNEWIDRTGDRPRWSDAALEKVGQGNNPGHNKGGRRGILVCYL